MKKYIMENLDIIVPFVLFIIMLIVVVSIALDDTPRTTELRVPKFEPESQITFDVRDIRRH